MSKHRTQFTPDDRLMVDVPPPPRGDRLRTVLSIGGIFTAAAVGVYGLLTMPQMAIGTAPAEKEHVLSSRFECVSSQGTLSMYDVDVIGRNPDGSEIEKRRTFVDHPYSGERIDLTDLTVGVETCGEVFDRFWKKYPKPEITSWE